MLSKLKRITNEFQICLTKKLKCPNCGFINEANTYYELQNTFQYDCKNCKGHIIIN